MAVPLSQRQIADEVIARIRAGTYPPGGLLPSWQRLADAYGVSYRTAGRVYALLKADGWVEASPGRGIYVVDHPPI